MEIEKDKDFRWPKPEKRDKNQFRRFYKDVGHDTNDCRQLMDEIEYLIRRVKCERFVKCDDEGGPKRDDDQGDNNKSRNPHPRGPVINMISEGPTATGITKNSCKAYVRDVMSIVGDGSKRAKAEMTLEFDNPDLDGWKFPQNDPLVITLLIGNCPDKRLLVDNGASGDILFRDVFQRMGYTDSQLTPSDVPFYGFNQVECQVKGAIRLPVTIGEEPR
ncbi:uncharacterized protein LOC141703662 [Apium graveolens]|uniref:uncharacterized protein LOC141703662 n=1 Tax=Apium graveolens TaxID=4045 RepID=UPI003D7B4A75